MDTTTTKTQNLTSMQDLGAELKSALRRQNEQWLAKFCEVCGQLKTQCACAEIAKRKAYEEKMRPIWEEQRKQRAMEAFKESESERLGGLRSFEDFTAAKYTNKAVLELLKNFPEENFYLWGKSGSGKTHAAVAVLRKIPTAQVVRMSRVSREIRSCETPDEEEEVIAKYSEGILLIDDLGSEKATEFLQNVLFEIMDRRWQSKRGGLIITSNMSIDRLADIIGDRTASRIAGLVGAKNIIEISGKDYRIS